jgi:hypothetical protein
MHANYMDFSTSLTTPRPICGPLNSMDPTFLPETAHTMGCPWPVAQTQGSKARANGTSPKLTGVWFSYL